MCKLTYIIFTPIFKQQSKKVLNNFLKPKTFPSKGKTTYTVNFKIFLLSKVIIVFFKAERMFNEV